MSGDAERISIEAADWLVRLRERPGDRKLASAFAAWCDADAAHVRAWEEMQALFDMIGSVEPNHPDYLAPAADGRSAPSQVRRALPKWRVAAMAAAIACIAVLGGPEIILRLRADHLTPAGGMANVALDDGSRVRLGPDSAIAVAYTPGHRNIRLLRGQAWFEVHPDPARPFRVEAEGIAATALGTAFDVRMIGPDRSVAVGHGRVRVEGAASSVLGAGDWVSAASGRAAVTGHQASDLAGIWRTGSVVIRGRTVAEAIEELRPWYKGRIVLADEAIGRKRVTGIFRLSDPEDALRALVQPHGGGIVQITPWLMIVTGN